MSQSENNIENNINNINNNNNDNGEDNQQNEQIGEEMSSEEFSFRYLNIKIEEIPSLSFEQIISCLFFYYYFCLHFLNFVNIFFICKFLLYCIFYYKTYYLYYYYYYYYYLKDNIINKGGVKVYAEKWQELTAEVTQKMMEVEDHDQNFKHYLQDQLNHRIQRNSHTEDGFALLLIILPLIYFSSYSYFYQFIFSFF